MKLPRWLHVSLNVYAFLLAMFFVWPVFQVLLTAFTSDLVFPPRYFSIDSWKAVVWSGLLEVVLVQHAHGSRRNDAPAADLCAGCLCHGAQEVPRPGAAVGDHVCAAHLPHHHLHLGRFASTSSLSSTS